MFFGKNGKTPSKAGLLDIARKPSYLKLGYTYGILEKEYCSDEVHDQIYLYRVVRTVGNQICYIKSPYDLPSPFWVRKIVGNFIGYEILMFGEGELAQDRRARNATMQTQGRVVA